MPLSAPLGCWEVMLVLALLEGEMRCMLKHRDASSIRPGRLQGLLRPIRSRLVLVCQGLTKWE